MSDKLEHSYKQVKDAETEVVQLKSNIEEMEKNTQDNMTKLQEAHQQEIANIRNFASTELPFIKPLGDRSTSL